MALRSLGGFKAAHSIALSAVGLIDPQESSGMPRKGYAWVALALTLAFLCAARGGEVRFGAFAVVLFPTSVIAYSAGILPPGSDIGASRFVFVELRAPIWAALMTFARRGRWHLVFTSQLGYDLVAVTLLPLAWLGRSMFG